jgi:diguanylate cyclase (GGDEF)-like protein
MHDHSPPKVLILARDAATARRWLDALAPAAAGAWLSAADVPPGERPEVVVTDGPVDDGVRGAGIVGIGPVPGADASLSPDCTDRELSLATVLVAQIARLRIERDELARNHEEVRQLAQTDPLTGLPNRRAWDEHLQARLDHPHRPLWLGVVDLDNFKQVNDRFGMARGDEVLARAARALAEQLRREDVVARLGGDEFGLLLGDMTEENLRRVFERLRAAVAEQASPDDVAPVTASIGFVSTGESPADAGALFAAAERAMREAKRGGGNRAIGTVLSPKRP